MLKNKYKQITISEHINKHSICVFIKCLLTGYEK